MRLSAGQYACGRSEKLGEEGVLPTSILVFEAQEVVRLTTTGHIWAIDSSRDRARAAQDRC